MKLDVALWQYFRNLNSPDFPNPKEFSVAIPNIIDSLDRKAFTFLNPIQDTVESAKEATEKASEFADIANTISADPLLWKLNPNNKLLSDTYSEILDEALFMDEELTSRKLSNTRAKFNQSNHRDGDFPYVSTECKPRELYKFDSPDWKKVILTGAKLLELEQQARLQITQDEYNRINNDIATPDLDIIEVSFETVAATIERLWFDEDLLKSRSWKFNPTFHAGRVISKGFDEYGGEMPAYATKLIFTRNVQVTLQPGSAKNTSIITQIMNGQIFIGRNIFSSIAQNVDPKTVTKISFSNLNQVDKSVLTTQYKLKLQSSKTYIPTKVNVGTKVETSVGPTSVKVTTAATSILEATKIGAITTVPITKVSTVVTGGLFETAVLFKPTNVVLMNNINLQSMGGLSGFRDGITVVDAPKAKVISDSYFSRLALSEAAKPALKSTVKSPTGSILASQIIMADWRNTMYVNPNPNPQHVITGKLLDNTTNAPMANFKLDLLSGDAMVLAIQTDNNGVFKFNVTNPGDYKIKINNIHFAVKAPSSDLILRFDRTNEVKEDPPIFLHAVVLKRLPPLPNPDAAGVFI